MFLGFGSSEEVVADLDECCCSAEEGWREMVAIRGENAQKTGGSHEPPNLPNQR